MIARVAGQTGKAFEHIRQIHVRPAVGRAGERLVCVTFRFCPLAFGDRDPGARRQRHRQMPAGHRLHGIVAPASGRDEIPVGQRNLGIERALSRRRLGHGHAQVLPGRLAGMLRRFHVARRQRGGGQRRIAHAREVLAQIGSGEGRIRCRPSRTRLPRKERAKDRPCRLFALCMTS